MAAGGCELGRVGSDRRGSAGKVEGFAGTVAPASRWLASEVEPTAGAFSGAASAGFMSPDAMSFRDSASGAPGAIVFATVELV